jgi:hypothetical protein
MGGPVDSIRRVSKSRGQRVEVILFHPFIQDQEARLLYSTSLNFTISLG